MNNRDFLIENWWKFVMFAMLGIVMYWTAIVIDPTFTLIEQNQEQNDLIIDQNEKIINNTNRNGDILLAYINASIANQDENLYLLASILNQSNIIGNQTADLILESIQATAELNKNITIKNDIQRAQIVEDITTDLDHIDKQLDGLSQQHKNITTNVTRQHENQTGKISGFLGGPLITNQTLDALKAGIIAQAQNRNGQ